ncbi:MAG: hypothetical protein K0S04_4011, partial [Herbinix sp.]|nr:hypothetical protein [Herbinix sp.]
EPLSEISHRYLHVEKVEEVEAAI